MSNQHETYEDMQNTAVNAVKAGQEIKKFYDKAKENSIEKMLMEKYKEMPFTFRGDHTDMAYFWGHDKLHMSEIEKLEPALRDKVKQNFTQYLSQDKFVKFDRGTNEYSLTAKGKKIINTKQFKQDVRNANFATDTILRDAVKNNPLNTPDDSKPKATTGDGVHDSSEPNVPTEGVEQQPNKPTTGDHVHETGEPSVESEGIQNQEAGLNAEATTEEAVTATEQAVAAEEAIEEAVVPDFLKEYGINDVLGMNGDVMDMSYFFKNDVLQLTELDKLTVEPSLKKAISDNLMGLKKDGFLHIDFSKKEATLTAKGKELIKSPKFIQKFAAEKQIAQGMNQVVNQGIKQGINLGTKAASTAAGAITGGVATAAVEGAKVIKQILSR